MKEGEYMSDKKSVPRRGPAQDSKDVPPAKYDRPAPPKKISK